LLNFYIIIFIF